MSEFTTHAYETDADEAPTRPGQLSSNGHWIFGSVFAGLIVAGLAFGLWVGVAKTKPVESAEKQKDNADKPTPPPQQKPPVVTPPVSDPPKPEPPKPEPPKPEPEPPKKDPPKTEPPKKDPPKSDPPVVAKAVAFKELRPFLDKYCISCHGALSGKQKGNIDLRTIAAIMKGGDNGDILKVGDPKQSKLYTSMLPGASEKMPPDDKPQPTEKEKQLIHDWIASGAKPRRTIRERGVRRGSGRARVQLTPKPPGG